MREGHAYRDETGRWIIVEDGHERLASDEHGRDLEILDGWDAARQAAPVGHFVYVVHGGDLYKIGRSGDPGKRLRALQCGSPIPLKVVHIFSRAYDHACRLEKELHEEFAEKRRHGEWFALDAHDLAALRRRA